MIGSKLQPLSLLNLNPGASDRLIPSSRLNQPQLRELYGDCICMTPLPKEGDKMLMLQVSMRIPPHPKSQKLSSLADLLFQINNRFLNADM